MALLGTVSQDPLYLVGRVKSLAEATMSLPFRRPYQQSQLSLAAQDKSRPVAALLTLAVSATGQDKMLHIRCGRIPKKICSLVPCSYSPQPQRPEECPP